MKTRKYDWIQVNVTDGKRVCFKTLVEARALASKLVNRGLHGTIVGIINDDDSGWHDMLGQF